jgi:hypothetical protein
VKKQHKRISANGELFGAGGTERVKAAAQTRRVGARRRSRRGVGRAGPQRGTLITAAYCKLQSPGVRL